jgi:hypothetical protein
VRRPIVVIIDWNATVSSAGARKHRLKQKGM